MARLHALIGRPTGPTRSYVRLRIASTASQIYTNVDQAAMHEAIAKLNRLLGGSDE
jgi:hypothetical protein